MSAIHKMHTPTLKQHAQELRRNMTRQEKHLWYDFLQKHPARFRRQMTIGKYIADFYSASARLVIELDGSQHYEPENLDYDRERTDFLFHTYEIRVIRFSNLDIDRNFQGVCQEIEKQLSKNGSID